MQHEKKSVCENTETLDGDGHWCEANLLISIRRRTRREFQKFLKTRQQCKERTIARQQSFYAAAANIESGDELRVASNAIVIIERGLEYESE